MWFEQEFHKPYFKEAYRLLAFSVFQLLTPLTTEEYKFRASRILMMGLLKSSLNASEFFDIKTLTRRKKKAPAGMLPRNTILIRRILGPPNDRDVGEKRLVK